VTVPSAITAATGAVVQTISTGAFITGTEIATPGWQGMLTNTWLHSPGTSAGTANFAIMGGSTTTAGTQKTVIKVDGNGNVQLNPLATTFTSNIFAVCSDDGTRFWITGSTAGLFYAPGGGTSASPSAVTTIGNAASSVYMSCFYAPTY